MINAQTGNHLAKRQDKDRDCQYQAGPELCRERSDLTILFLLACNAGLRLEPHSTDRAITRVVLLDLGMHWTGVDCLTDWQTIGGIGKSFRLRVEDVLGFPRDLGPINLLDAVHINLVLVIFPS